MTAPTRCESTYTPLDPIGAATVRCVKPAGHPGPYHRGDPAAVGVLAWTDPMADQPTQPRTPPPRKDIHQ